MSTNQIREFKVANLIKEAVTLALYEQKLHEADPNMVPPPAPNGGATPPAPPAPPADQNAVPSATDPNAPQQGGQPLTVDSMIERLNVIRGGRSFTDPEIYGQFTTFFKQLAPEQLQTIDQFLQDISKIVVNVESQATAEPNAQQTQAPAQQNNTGTQAPISAGNGANPAAASGGGMPGV